MKFNRNELAMLPVGSGCGTCKYTLNIVTVCGNSTKEMPCTVVG